MFSPAVARRWPVLLVCGLVLVAGAYFALSRGGSSASPGVNVRLETGATAPLGGTMTLRMTVVTTSDGPNAEIVFDLPPGVVPADGQARRQVQFKKGVSQTFELQVKLVEPGEHMINAIASIYHDDGGQRGNLDRLYLEVGATKTEVRRESLTPEPTSEGMESVTLDEIETSESLLQATNEAGEQVQTPKPTAEGRN
jgi:hypothetical protein